MAERDIEKEEFAKVIHLGATNVGKKSLVLRVIGRGHFIRSIPPDYYYHFVNVGNTVCKLQLWLTAGQERFFCLSTAYYRGASAVVLVYDITSRKSYDELVETWFPEVKDRCGSPEVVYVLVGTKADLSDKREVAEGEAAAFAVGHGMRYFETSAKTGTGVEEVYHTLASDLVDGPWAILKRPGGVRLPMLNGPPNPPPKAYCC